MTTAADIISTEFPRGNRLERLAELEEKLSGPYVGGMTEYWQRQKDFLLSEKGQEIADVFDGPEQECHPHVCLEDFVTNPSHGGKITCHQCNGFILKKEVALYTLGGDEVAYFHKDCLNPYEHYHGLDKPIDY